MPLALCGHVADDSFRSWYLGVIEMTLAYGRPLPSLTGRRVMPTASSRLQREDLGR